ncbi:hypothetical protein [Methylobacterium gnaphalii]|uniref:Uncharacterized protein n=1 Tax=Methylobacterium gnaphalii TaxID=1010610 RepID=A0A512JGG2_9HYPH|nr:hypothetical protein [Methylobacterium gnaphalii]GEP09041.1 hypothetical protein MGN01_08860 [Methylobacterium gnaphalii]GJD68352.1 hypothetical protein MMMDOFMJ_1275 [Methylobacterium gnaphalii]
MSDTNSITASFPTLEAARSARKRLARAGFARNSIDIERRRDDFEVSIRTRDENRRRAEAILHRQSMPLDVGQVADGARSFVERNRGLSIGLAALAGFMLFGLTNRR